MSHEITVYEAVSINQKLNDELRAANKEISELKKENNRLKAHNKSMASRLKAFTEAEEQLSKDLNIAKSYKNLKEKHKKALNELNELRKKQLTFDYMIEKCEMLKKEVSRLVDVMIENNVIFDPPNDFDDMELEYQKEINAKIQKIMSKASNRLKLAMFRILRTSGIEPVERNGKPCFGEEQIAEFIISNESIISYRNVGVHVDEEYKQLRFEINKLYGLG